MRKTTNFLLFFVLTLGMVSAFAQKQQQRRRPARKAQTQDTRVYLVHADVLHYDQTKNADATILNGKVHFTHQGHVCIATVPISMRPATLSRLSVM